MSVVEALDAIDQAACKARWAEVKSLGLSKELEDQALDKLAAIYVAGKNLRGLIDNIPVGPPLLHDWSFQDLAPGTLPDLSLIHI